ncbi:hypothetical protein KKG72_09390 [bacterium]|nr:hypothetical protein [bacterium]MBU1993097.1 hypothetical protein [bacterium]
MYRILFLFILVLFFGGCVGSTPKVIQANQKVFEDEDAYILFALRAEQLKEHKASASIFNTLYEKSGKKEYIYRSLQNDLVAGDNENVVKRIDEITKGALDDFILMRLKIVALAGLEMLEKAKNLALSLVESSHEVDDYILVSDIYVKEKKFDTALKYLESAYAKNYNEKILDKMSIILYVNLQRKSEAIAQLETHARMHSCSVLICSRLIGFYSNENDIEGLLSVYLRLYELESNEEIAKKIIQIYQYKKEYIQLMDFLEQSNTDDALLLQLYTSAKNYKKAADLADKLYTFTGEINYLGQSAIFEYESSVDKNDGSMHTRVLEKLKKVLLQEENSLYLNYYGYIMIDHNIDVKSGIEYIQRALNFEPNSAYYLDSLAWGYYKLGNCVKAKKIMDKVVKLEGGNDKEVVSHIESIDNCLKLKKGKK